MRGEPSQNLVELLTRLKLATAEQLQSVTARVRRLAGNLPDFESIWVDALAQARILSPMQAAEINAGRGESLLQGPYVLTKPLASPHYAACFAARHVETERTVRLYLVRRPLVDIAPAARALSQLIERLAALRGSAAGVVDDAGSNGGCVWAVCPEIAGVTAADWGIENGRFPHQVVLQIAREMLVRLVELERFGIAHGDIGAAGLLLQSSGHVALPMPGLRGIVRPGEGYAFNDLQPEAYDYLAPERISAGSATSLTTDIYACGCLWWHLLTGRPPFSGGNSLAKLKAAHAAKSIDVRQLAIDVPDVLAQAIAMCMAREPTARPQSISELSKLLGAPTRAGCAAVARCLRHQAPLWSAIRAARPPRSARRKQLPIAAGLVTAAAVVVLALLPLWRRSQQSPAMAQRAPSAKPVTTKGNEPLGDPLAIDEVSRRDTRIRPVAAMEPVDDAPQDLMLPAGKKMYLSQLSLKPGQHVRGAAGQRPLVCLSGTGLGVECEDVCFENIDFVWEPAGSGEEATSLNSAMILVESQAIEFRGCSFSSAEETAPIAIAWSGADDAPSGLHGELTLRDCVFSGVAAVIDCQGTSALSVEMTNSLCLAAGPVVRLHRAPKSDEALSISLDHLTTRGDCSVLECRYSRLDDPLGTITICVTDSALDTNPRGGLLILAGGQRPDRLLSTIAWNGQGSLVPPHTAVALWRSGARKQQILSEDQLAVAGLVRSHVEFSGSAAGPASASRVTRWQVPLRSDDPPGANTNSLYLPAKPAAD